MAMLEIRNLFAGYFGKEVLHGISATAHAGQITVVIGPNGCGKSTLLKTICGILPAASGRVLLDEQELLVLPQKMLARKVSYLAQNRQTSDITVERLVLHGRFPYLSYPRHYRKEDHLIAEKVMEQMQILNLAQAPLSMLSGGQQQKVYIAMTLAQDTDVILLDEPTTYLDISHQLQMIRHARSLADAGKHVVMVIHDLSLALQAADRVVLMRNGTLAVQGTPEDIYISGCMDEIFGVRVSRTRIEDKWHYFCMGK